MTFRTASRDSDLWSSDTVQRLLASQAKSPLAQLVKRWRESQLEVERLTARLEAVSEDKVMSSRIRQMREDQENACRLYVERVAETRARNATDLIWKLFVAADAEPADAGLTNASQSVSHSALIDLISFVKTSERVRGAKA